MLDVSDQSTELVEQQFDLGIQNSGKVGSARGTGARGLGKGPGKGDFRENNAGMSASMTD